MVITRVSYRLLHFVALHFYLASCNFYPFVGAIYVEIFELVTAMKKDNVLFERVMMTTVNVYSA